MKREKTLLTLFPRKTRFFASKIIVSTIFLNLLAQNTVALVIDADTISIENNLCSIISQESDRKSSSHYDPDYVRCSICLGNENSENKIILASMELYDKISEGKSIFLKADLINLEKTRYSSFNAQGPPNII